MTTQKLHRDPCEESREKLEEAKGAVWSEDYNGAIDFLREAQMVLPARLLGNRIWTIEPEIYELLAVCQCRRVEDPSLTDIERAYDRAEQITKNLYGENSVFVARLLVNEAEELARLRKPMAGRAGQKVRAAEKILFGSDASPPIGEMFLTGKWYSLHAQLRFLDQPDDYKTLVLEHCRKATRLMGKYNSGSLDQMQSYLRHLKRYADICVHYNRWIRLLWCWRKEGVVARKTATD